MLGQIFAFFFFCFSFFPFHLLYGKFRLLQFSFVAVFVESHIVLSFRNLDYVHTEWIQKPLKLSKPRYDFAISECGKYVDKSPCPWSIMALFLWNCDMQSLRTSFVWACDSAQSRSQHWSGWGGGDEREEGMGVEGRGTGKIVYSCLKLSGIDLLIGFNFRIIHKNLWSKHFLC